METVQQSSTVAALDIGSEKIAVAVADASEGGELTLLGFGKVPSLGIQHGSVQDVELAVESIRAAIAEAEQTSRRKVTTVSVALTGKHLHSINKVGQLVLPDAEVDSAAVKRVTRLAMAFDPKVEGQSQDDRLVSHVVKGYTLDNDDVMIDDPIGMVGSVIKAHVHLAIGSDSVVQNLVKCIRRAGLDIEGLVLQPWASAAGVLTPTDKELGVVVLDIGAGTTDISCWEKVTNLNMNGTVYPSLVFSKVMAKQGKGCIVNVSSMAAYSAITRVPGYSAAKTAVANFTQWLASELALKYGDGIRVNAIAPGFFIGDQNRAVLINPDGSLTDRSKKVLAKTPMKRFGDINELNGAVQFLCSDAASFVTGALLPIDGGFSAFSGV